MTEATISVKPKVSGTTLHKLRTREQITGYLFTLPALIVILVFGLFPILYSFYMSLFNWRVTKGAFVGDKNYLLIFGNWTNLLITLAGVALIVGAFWVWSNAFKSLSKGETIAKVLAAVVMADLAIFLGHFAKHPRAHAQQRMSLHHRAGCGAGCD